MKKDMNFNSSVVLSIAWQMILMFLDMHSQLIDEDRFNEWLKSRRAILIDEGKIVEEEVDAVFNQMSSLLKIAKERDRERLKEETQMNSRGAR